MYIQVTEIDASTKILCTEEPMRTGPELPKLNGFKFIFSNQSTFPITTNQEGIYSRTPLFYGTCFDDADTTLTGVLKILTLDEFNADKETEHQARKPFPSWIGDIDTMEWQSPVPYPQDNKYYTWDEITLTWIDMTPVPE